MSSLCLGPEVSRNLGKRVNQECIVFHLLTLGQYLELHAFLSVLGWSQCAVGLLDRLNCVKHFG